jgi:hypothetical protein
MIRELLEDEVEFSIECLPEDASIEGNCSAIDRLTDQCVERWIRRELEQGNLWAWCCVRVVARWRGFEGEDFLGCCSYRNEKEFRHPEGYFPQMRDEALRRLNEVVAQTDGRLAPLRARGPA